MTVLNERLELMAKLGHYLLQNNDKLEETIHSAYTQNAWFTIDYTKLAIKNIVNHFLQIDLLKDWIQRYPKLQQPASDKMTVGLIMAGNIPLVGFHDFLCIYIAGFKAKLKLSSKDTVLWKHIIGILSEWDPNFKDQIEIAEMLKNCDAYIATGSNQSAQHFIQYFGKYPHIIRHNRTSIAILPQQLSDAEAYALENDFSQFFGLGCRNVSQIWVPRGFDFELFIAQIKHFQDQMDHHKMKNNYDYQLAMFILNKVPYMSNGNLLFVENEISHAPIAVINYAYYNTLNDIFEHIDTSNIQCIATSESDIASIQALTTIPVMEFGNTQVPALSDYADGVDVMEFLSDL